MTISHQLADQRKSLNKNAKGMAVQVYHRALGQQEKPPELPIPTALRDTSGTTRIPYNKHRSPIPGGRLQVLLRLEDAESRTQFCPVNCSDYAGCDAIESEHLSGRGIPCCQFATYLLESLVILPS